MDRLDPRVRMDIIQDLNRGKDHPETAWNNDVPLDTVRRVLAEHLQAARMKLAGELEGDLRGVAIRLVKAGWSPYVVWMNFCNDVSLDELTHIRETMG